MRGLPGNPVDRDRHLGFRKLAEAPGNKFEIVEVVGNRDDGTAQKVVADAVAVQKKFDGMFAQAGATGAVRALIDARHEMIPVAAADENGFRKLCASNAKDGLLCTSIVQSPGLVAISMKAAVSALQGKVMPQMISVPVPSTSHPNFKAGTRTDAQTVALMIGRDIEHAYPPKPAARHAAGLVHRWWKPAAWHGTTGCMTSTSRCGPVRSSASAGSTARVSASLPGALRRAARRDRGSAARWPTGHGAQPEAGEARRGRHRPRARRPQDRKTDILVTLDLEVLYPQMARLLSSSRLRKLVVGNIGDHSAYPAAVRAQLQGAGQLSAVRADDLHLTFDQLLANVGAYRQHALVSSALNLTVEPA